ncbi:3-deoxy-D-manno-octulosonic-acid transferase [Chitinivorax tropicus]|uniref:3-deoxy-D-manno-octulosonic acid transferase n=1 Tax=Chitinivorax tropicus TaxID=714531 RepID=A0A840MPJ4_9PROT|nr:lipid IV(A) 3-deoxy-D-manno-octulosonic acid transferase [Chitinivorax tropicus]MBB5019375.1 3-deoxy-D-manno-octulosonic-acid transferase [Chitinivorax tropicus]
MRWWYTQLFRLLVPMILLRLWWRGRKQRGYRQHWAERFGIYQQKPTQPVIWLHAVSVGETRAAQPLINALYEAYPGHRIVLTQMTPTGRDTASAMYGQKVEAVFLPYDLPGAVDRFLRHFKPVLGLLMETEIWPNLIHAARQHGVPLYLVNARLSARSARGYGRIESLVRPALQSLRGIAAQSDADAARLRLLGNCEVQVCGNIKFDVQLPPAQLELGQHWRAQLGRRPVVVFGSSRDGEEALLLKAWQDNPPDALLVIVPRHPQRFDEVAGILEASGMQWAKRSEQPVSSSLQVWLGDSMGELYAYYAMADCALIGGGFMPLGGQNLIEACATGCPAIVGPHMFNFTDVTRLAIEAGAACQVADMQQAVVQIRQWLNDVVLLKDVRESALQFAQLHAGATQRTLALLVTTVH